MKRNFDMDAAIRRALRESIEAHAHEWEPKFKTGVGPVGDDAPFDKKVSGDVNEGKDCEECCPKCGKCPCECDKVNEGTIPGDSHEWEPDFKTGVGPVGDDNPFTQAVNEAFVEGGDWEKDSFGASDHKKEGISFADGGDECQNGVVATGQKNSGEVVSKDNLSEGEDESTMGQFIKNGWNGLKRRWNQAKEQDMANKGWVRADSVNSGNGGPQETDNVKTTNTTTGNGIQPGSDEQPKAQMIQPKEQPEQPKAQPEQPKEQPEINTKQPGAQTEPPTKPATGAKDAQQATETVKPDAGTQEIIKYKQVIGQLVKTMNEIGSAQAANKILSKFGINAEDTWKWESKEVKKDVIAEERDRFFDIINRIEKLYD